MRIGELSRRTGVPVPTIKYYVREGLLPAGELTSPNQATYGDGHERRLRLIRSLLGVGGLSLSRIGEILAVVDDTSQPVFKLMGEVAGAVAAPSLVGSGEPSEAARASVAGLAGRRGWHVPPGHPDGEALARTLTEAERLGHEDFAVALDAYAEAAEKAAGADLAYVRGLGARDDVLEGVVIGMVLGDAMFGSLRRIAQAEETGRIYGRGADGSSLSAE
ncbi:MerR family transcriptional regulator [Streptomyces sp. NBC_00237]|uniref:MerR family transcriptional regulator n=1 Tax=Streptomyces sp. NBC_00237 TaxID=2975687 RepID=UPI002259912A|nr:MerR family transcriptional regulator [Streptomyces sp. NBC_00237]MCX5202315.1 MerR family transcriptional regulator [Streptomyces sp. NBC_00237]